MGMGVGDKGEEGLLLTLRSFMSSRIGLGRGVLGRFIKGEFELRFGGCGL